MNQKYMFTGSSCAGAVAAGIACFFLGLVMLLQGDQAEVLFMNDVLRDYSTIVIALSIVVWLLGWYYLHVEWKNKHIRRMEAYKAAIILVVLGTSGTFFSILKFSVF